MAMVLCIVIRDQSILLFSLLFFFPAILFYSTYYAQYFAQEIFLAHSFYLKSCGHVNMSIQN